MNEVKMPIAYSVTLYTLLQKMIYTNDFVSQGGETPIERELPFNVKYKLHRNFDILLKDYSYFETQRNSLIRQYGEEKDGKITVKPENVETYRQELLKAINIEVTHTFVKLTLEDVSLIGVNINTSTEEMQLFNVYLVDDESFIKDLQTEIGKEEKADTEETATEPIEDVKESDSTEEETKA